MPDAGSPNTPLTEQSAIEEEMMLSEERLRSALRFAGMLSWDYDARTKTISYSQDVREFFNVPDMPAGADLDYGMIHADDRARIRAEVMAARNANADYRIEYRGDKPDAEGRVQWFATRGSFIRTSDGVIARSLGVTANITERKTFELQRHTLDSDLREARHLESLGLLAGGIAHDFNNLLTIILGNVGLVSILTGEQPAVAKCLGEIDGACQRAADLCNQIAAYAGVGRLLATEFDFNDLLRESEPGFRGLIRRGITLISHLESKPCRVVGEVRQIRQALGNVLINASEALSDRGGEIEIRTERIAFDRTPEGFRPPIAIGEYVAIRIRDTGSGMPEHVRARAFEAFFSTKFTGRGLGLAAVYGIVRSHKGSVRILSHPGSGTTVELLFPVKPEAVQNPVGGNRTETGVPRSRVLIVDDEANIRELICSVLEDDGYAVVAAENGEDAEAIFATDTASFRLAVVDLVLPGIRGQELILRMRQKVAGFPVIVVSGYAEREMPADLVNSGPTLVLPKPFRLEQLSEAVKKLTSSAPPS